MMQDASCGAALIPHLELTTRLLVSTGLRTVCFLSLSVTENVTLRGDSGISGLPVR